MKGGSSIIFLIIVIVVFYFLMIVPQRRQQRKRTDMMKQIGPGARVMTASGLYAEIVETRGDVVVARIADGVVVEMDSRAVVRVIEEAAQDEEFEEPTENEDGHRLGAPDEYEDEDEEFEDEEFDDEEEDESDEDDSDEAGRQFDEHLKRHGE